MKTKKLILDVLQFFGPLSERQIIEKLKLRGVDIPVDALRDALDSLNETKQVRPTVRDVIFYTKVGNL